MGEPNADVELNKELRSLLASGRALAAELSEEGVCQFERLDPPEPFTAAPATPTLESERPAPRTRSARATETISTKREPRTPQVDVGIGGHSETVPWEGRIPTLDEVRAHLGDCERCGLCRGRRSIVFGDGNPEADLMFIGEGPGEQEDRRGLPFVGRAGELLTQMIEKGLGISRADVYICNIVKCRPPQNRNPLPPEVSACRAFLDGQIKAVAPRVIVTLGKPAASLLLDREVAITRVRGTWHEYGGVPLMPTLHPAYVLRQYTTENRRAVWQDLQLALERSRS